MADFVTIKDLSDELGIDKSNLRKFILAQGIEPLNVRTPESRGQLTLALAPEEAQAIRDIRMAQGFSPNEARNPREYNGNGVFYVIQIIPEFEPNRVKLGFASNVENRLQAHKTSAPTATLVQTWDCKRHWEDVAMASATRSGCKLIANEVFLCDDLDKLLERIDSFFDQMPDLIFKIDRV